MPCRFPPEEVKNFVKMGRKEVSALAEVLKFRCDDKQHTICHHLHPFSQSLFRTDVSFVASFPVFHAIDTDTALQLAAAGAGSGKSKSFVATVKDAFMAVVNAILNNILSAFRGIKSFVAGLGGKKVEPKSEYDLFRDKVIQRAAANPGMWPPVVVPPAKGTKRSVSSLREGDLQGKRCGNCCLSFPLVTAVHCPSPIAMIT